MTASSSFVQVLTSLAFMAVFLRFRCAERRLRFSLLLYCLPISLYFPKTFQLFKPQYDDWCRPVQHLFASDSGVIQRLQERRGTKARQNYLDFSPPFGS